MLPLEGIRVLDITEAHVGPYATQLLAEMGAEVIKVERHGGDRTRLRSLAVDRTGIPSSFLALNCDKRDITIDLTKDEGKEIALKLAERSDVFVQNMRPGAIERLGLGYEEVSKRNPRIIYASTSMYGTDGPDGMKPGYDILAQARGGVMSRNMVDGVPTGCPAAIGDHLGALYLSYGIVVALLTRERTGIGQRIDTSMLGGQLALQSREITHYLIGGELLPSWKSLMGALWQAFKAEDIWICLGGVSEDRWPRFCKVLGITHLVGDPRFATPRARMDNEAELLAVLHPIFATRTAQEWITALEEEDIFVTVVNTIDRVVEDPQVIANDLITELDYPGNRKVRVVATPIRFSKTPFRRRNAAPDLGEHTHEILEELGYSWEEIAQLVADGVV